MDKLDLESTSYSAHRRLSKLVNNQLISDVQFLVGESKIKVYEHRFVLSLGSEVFQKMFYGDLKTDLKEPIEITDLEINGFVNMLRYIYEYKVDLKVEDISSTYLASDKYLVYHFPKALSEYIKSITNYDNVFSVFDQLNKLKFMDGVTDVLPFSYVEKIVRTSSSFDSIHHLEVDQASLIEILKMNELVIPEIELLKFCTYWTDEELKRKNLESTADNCRKTFEPFKLLICFSQIEPLELMKFTKIKNYLSSEDLVNYFLYLPDSTDLNSLDLKKKREKSKISIVSFASNRNVTASNMTFTLKVDKFFSIEHFQSCAEATNVNVYENDKILSLNWNTIKLSNNYFKVKTDLPIILKPDCTYKFTFKTNVSIPLYYETVKEDLDQVNLVSNGIHCFYAVSGFLLDN